MPVAAFAGSCLQDLRLDFSVSVRSKLRFKVVFVHWNPRLFLAKIVCDPVRTGTAILLLELTLMFAVDAVSSPTRSSTFNLFKS